MMSIRQSFRKMARQPSQPNLQANLSDAAADENDSSASKKKKCSDHYCLECGVLACTRCLTRAGKHSGHDVIELSEAFEKPKEEIVRAMEPLQTQLLAIDKA
jgi:membrane protease subunit (stomatin/prohibitin family)